MREGSTMNRFLGSGLLGEQMNQSACGDAGRYRHTPCLPVAFSLRSEPGALFTVESVASKHVSQSHKDQSDLAAFCLVYRGNFMNIYAHKALNR